MSRMLQRFLPVFALAVGLTCAGCGVSKDEHAQTVSKLHQAQDDLEAANARVAELKQALERAKAEISALAARKDEKAAAEPAVLAQDFQLQLATAEQEADRYKAQLQQLTDENSRLGKMVADFEVRMAQLEKKMEEIMPKGGDTAKPLLEKP